VQPPALADANSDANPTRLSVNQPPELDQIRDLEEKIRRLSEERAHSSADPEFQHRLNAHLLALVEQRAREAERNNRLLQEHVRELQVRKERIATTVHDLKVPVTISMLNLELAEAETDPHERAQHLTAVHRELAFLLDTIANLLDIERDVPARGTIVPVNLPELADELLGRVAVLIRDKPGVTLQNSLPRDLPAVRGDAHRLMRVFSNLVSNAIKYTDTGTIEIGHISMAPSALPGYLRVFVRDTGAGISAARRDKLFQLFAGDESRYDSSGVGLVFVKQTIESYGGRIFLDSTEGAGTTVTLELSIARNAT
jgi:signal transduction histidine kinase